jgi:hypothetical protein
MIRFISPLLVLVSAGGMLAWTWSACPDPVIDYGREVYVPWRLAQGEALYRDINYFNGPLSPYVDALLFKIFGARIDTLKIFNAIVVLGLVALWYAMIFRIAGRCAATVAGMLLPVLFACQQIASPTFNFLTPYSYDLTHGIFLATLMVGCLWRAATSPRAVIWIACAGATLGLVFLTKAEVFLGAAMGAAAGMWALLSVLRPSPGRLLRWCALFIGAAIVPALLSFLALRLVMPSTVALCGLAGSWKWLGDEQLGNMYYFRWITGLVRPGQSVAQLLAWTAAYSVIVAGACGAARLLRDRPLAEQRRAALIVAVVVAAPIILAWQIIPWVGFLRPLPLVILGISLQLCWKIARSQASDAARLVLTAALAALSGGLLLRIVLHANSFHYGFALAMPATMLSITLLVGWLPARVERGGLIVRAAMIAMWLAIGYAHVRMNAAWIARRSHVVSAAGDAFRADSYGPIAQQAIGYLNSSTSDAKTSSGAQTLVCMPEGLLINFLARRVNPTPDLNFSPPALVMYGEGNILSRLRAHPPDFIALINTDDAIYRPHDAPGPWLFGKNFARDIGSWIRQNYQAVELFGAMPYKSDLPGILLLHRREPGPGRSGARN